MNNLQLYHGLVWILFQNNQFQQLYPKSVEIVAIMFFTKWKFGLWHSCFPSIWQNIFLYKLVAQCLLPSLSRHLVYLWPVTTRNVYPSFHHRFVRLACQPTSQQYYSLILNQQQPPATSQSAVLFSHNKSAPATSHIQVNTANDVMTLLFKC